MSERFMDRRAAGRDLARCLAAHAGRGDVLVLGLPRGGVPVALEVARALRVPLDVFVVRKLGVPGHEELAFGALASGGVLVLNEPVVEYLLIDEGAMSEVVRVETRELERRDQLYRDGRPPHRISGKTVIVVDDGLATGASMRAAVAALRRHGAARIVVAVPVAPREACAELRRVADQVVCVSMPENFLAVGTWYEDFRQVSDEEVRDLLRAATAPSEAPHLAT